MIWGSSRYQDCGSEAHPARLRFQPWPMHCPSRLSMGRGLVLSRCTRAVEAFTTGIPMSPKRDQKHRRDYHDQSDRVPLGRSLASIVIALR